MTVPIDFHLDFPSPSAFVDGGPRRGLDRFDPIERRLASAGL